ncbi:MAG: ABC transporter ATP-binding protein [Methanomicrobiales archaeon]|nr:ABC transporter ATP-binding protein [Methanomicrobiales archaeon]
MKGRITAENLHAGYGSQDIIRSISCSFAPGTFTGIIGPNGSGKTTLLRAFSRVIPSGGILQLDGRDIRDFAPAELGMALGFVPQDEARPFSYTVMQVVLMARYARTSRFASLGPEDYARCHEALADTGVAHLAGRSIRTLSGGEWQRVLIARALAQDTGVLLLDEPTSHLDLAHQVEVVALMKERAGAGRTIIGVFHDLNLAALACDRLLMVKDGELVADGTPSEVLTPERIRQVYGAEVAACRHPFTGTPLIVPVTTANGIIPLPHRMNVLVISGGGSGSDLMRFLTGKGLMISAGILATTDTDYHTATALGIPTIPVMPFSQIPVPALDKLKDSLAQADAVVLSAHPIGAGNLPVLQLLRDTDPERIVIHLPEGRDFASCDFAHGAAAAVYADLCQAGARCTPAYDGILRLLSPDPDGCTPEGREP